MAHFSKAKSKWIYNIKSKLEKKSPKGFKSINLKLDELLFDSKSEMNAYVKLRLQEKQGLISNLRLQVPFLLTPKTSWYNSVKQKKEAVREMNYIADFTFTRDSQNIIMDCKGWSKKVNKKTGKETWTVFVDDVYKVKKKLMLMMYPEYLFEEI
jgi:hypothetical protein